MTYLLLTILLMAAVIDLSAAQFTAFHVEEQPAGKLIFDFKKAAGEPAGSFVLTAATTISGSSVRELFEIEPRTGILRNTKKLDREQLCKKRVPDEPASCDVTILCVLPDLQPTKILSLVLTIKDINDNAPFFPLYPGGYPVSVAENAGVGTNIDIPKAKDGDALKAGDLIYSLEGGGDTFRLVTEDSGAVSLELLRELDREERETYDLTLRASDQDPLNPRSDSLRINLVVTDVNDHAPECDDPLHTISLLESFSIGTTVVRVTARDADAGSNGRLSYKLVNSPDSLTFRIADSRGGAVELRRPLDRETREAYIIKVRVSDQGSPQRHTVCEVVVKVEDVNDVAPIITFIAISPDETGRPAVPETARLGTVVALVRVTDGDVGDHARVTCRINSTYFSLEQNFKASSTQYLLKTNAEFDREKTSVYEVEVVCSNPAPPGNIKLSTSENYKVIITDTNDERPQFEGGAYQHATIQENQPIGTRIRHVTAVDKDAPGTVASQVRYRWMPGTDQTNFALNSDTGVVTTAARLDREKDPEGFTVKIVAYDAGTPPQSATVTLSIEIADENDHNPDFGQSEFHYFAQVGLENQLITILQAVDLDRDENSRLEYSIDLASSPLAKYYQIRENNQLMMFSTRNRVETARFKVIASDFGEPRRWTTAWINVHHVLAGWQEPVLLAFPRNSSDTLQVPIQGLQRGTLIGGVEVWKSDNFRQISTEFVLSSTTTPMLIMDKISGDLRLIDPVNVKWIGKKFSLSFVMSVTSLTQTGQGMRYQKALTMQVEFVDRPVSTARYIFPGVDNLVLIIAIGVTSAVLAMVVICVVIGWKRKGADHWRDGNDSGQYKEDVLETPHSCGGTLRTAARDEAVRAGLQHQEPPPPSAMLTRYPVSSPYTPDCRSFSNRDECRVRLLKQVDETAAVTPPHELRLPPYSAAPHASPYTAPNHPTRFATSPRRPCITETYNSLPTRRKTLEPTPNDQLYVMTTSRESPYVSACPQRGSYESASSTSDSGQGESITPPPDHLHQNNRIHQMTLPRSDKISGVPPRDRRPQVHPRHPVLSSFSPPAQDDRCKQVDFRAGPRAGPRAGYM